MMSIHNEQERRYQNDPVFRQLVDMIYKAVCEQHALSAARQFGHGTICKTHGLAVLVTHVNDGEPCSDWLAAPQQAQPPQGFVLVPGEPTKKMSDAGGHIYRLYLEDNISYQSIADRIFRAMIFAAKP